LRAKKAPASETEPFLVLVRQQGHRSATALVELRPDQDEAALGPALVFRLVSIEICDDACLQVIDRCRDLQLARIG
jgi:hypothetical protein